MDTWIWIVIAVVVVLAALFVVGLVLSKRRQVSLTDRPDTPAVEKDTKPKGGGYKAGGSISFSSGGGTALEDRPSTPERAEPAPAAPTRPGQTSAGPAPAEAIPAEPGTAESGTAESGTAEPVSAEPVSAEPTQDELGGRPSGPAGAPTAQEPGTVVPGTVEPGPEAPDRVAEADQVTSGDVASDTSEPQMAEQQTADQAEPTGLAPTAGEPVVTDVPSTPEAGTPPAEQTPSAPEAPAPVMVEPGTAPAAEEIAPADGRLNRLRGRLSRSQNAFGRSMLGLLGAGNLDEDSWIDVEDTLLLADLGAQASTEIADKLRDDVAAHGLADPAAARALLRRVMIEAVDPTMDRSVRALPHDGRPSVLLVVGVNGTGKTTTTGKLARVLVAQGRDVLLGAADTFRAAAADQLATWAERTGATVVRAKEGTDPASVAFDSVKAGIDGGVDAVLIDTAGRLHTKTGLMDELGKVKRVIEKQARVDEVLLVLDATTGQNGLVQARVFAEVVDITGIVLTKLDGTAKGGIVVAVQRALGVPVKLVGLGEGPDDLAPFEAEAFVDALLGD